MSFFLSCSTKIANTLGDGFAKGMSGLEYCVKNGGGVVASVGLGAIAGPFTAMGARVGLSRALSRGPYIP